MVAPAFYGRGPKGPGRDSAIGLYDWSKISLKLVLQRTVIHSWVEVYLALCDPRRQHSPRALGVLPFRACRQALNGAMLGFCLAVPHSVFCPGGHGRSQILH